MRIQRVKEGLYRIPLAWSNAYLLRDGDDAALIDTGLQKDRPALLAAFTALGLPETSIRSIFLTHAHTDHGGNAAYFARQGANIGLHKDEAPYLGLPRRTYIPRGASLFLHPVSALLFAAGEILYPVERHAPHLLFADADVIDAPGGPLRVIACPGHSPGHAAYFREHDGILFSGDSILNIVPLLLTETLSLPMRVFSHDWEQAKRSAALVAQLQPQILLSGHGRPLETDTATRLLDWAKDLY